MRVRLPPRPQNKKWRKMKKVLIQTKEEIISDEVVENADDDFLNLIIFNTIFDYHNPERYGRIGACGVYTGRHFSLLIRRLWELKIDVDMNLNHHGICYATLWGGGFNAKAMDFDYRRAVCKASVLYWLSYGLEVEKDFITELFKEK